MGFDQISGRPCKEKLITENTARQSRNKKQVLRFAQNDMSSWATRMSHSEQAERVILSEAKDLLCFVRHQENAPWVFTPRTL